MDRERLRLRAAYLAEIRDFFSGRGYLEVDTPLLAPALIPEPALEIFKTEFVSPYRKGKDLYLIPSPELWMKRLIASGSGDIFQITKAFRNAEAVGRIHNPEFTILEWYTIGADYLGSLETTEGLFDRLAGSGGKVKPDRLAPPFRRMTMEEAFREFAGFDLAPCGAEDLRERAKALGIKTEESDTWEAAFNRIFVDRVEPSLPRDRPLALLDYPAEVKCLAKRIPGTPWRERWELYVDGIETANCFTEETDPVEVKRYFREEAEAKRSNLVPHPADEGFLEIYGPAYPACSGVALGVDRLLMSLFGLADIEGVILFPFSIIIDA